MADLSERFEHALCYAAQLHVKQRRKASNVPYVAHLLSVTGLVLEYGGDEDEAIAALLHDAAEDQGGEATLAEIRNRFGARVAEIVAACSDTLDDPKPPWRERKEQAIATARAADPSVRLVMAADKLHNATSVLREWRDVGDDVWQRFRGGRDGSLWYYREMAVALASDDRTGVTRELVRVVAELHDVTGEPWPDRPEQI
ncbi:MAG: HD domain-containing protein [Pirellulales bacterium]|nr:HD domain-containing protein [Planctomycetales bacterium]